MRRRGLWLKDDWGLRGLKEAYYFSHDCNAYKDPKILKLRAEHGWAGYGIFWAIIETLREQNDYKWKASDKQLLSFCFGNGDEVINDVLETCLEIELLVVDDDGFIHSESLTNRMKKKDEVVEKRRQAGKKGGSTSKAEAKPKQNGSKERKGNEKKGKETTTTAEAKEVFNFYEKNIGVIKPLLSEEIGHWIDDMSADVVLASLKIACKQNVYKWSYCEAMLKDWISKGYKTIDDINAHMAERERGKLTKFPNKDDPHVYEDLQPIDELRSGDG